MPDEYRNEEHIMSGESGSHHKTLAAKPQKTPESTIRTSNSGDVTN